MLSKQGRHCLGVIRCSKPAGVRMAARPGLPTQQGLPAYLRPALMQQVQQVRPRLYSACTVLLHPLPAYEKGLCPELGSFPEVLPDAIQTKLPVWRPLTMLTVVHCLVGCRGRLSLLFL